MEDKNKDYSELLNEVHWDTILTMPFQLNKKVKMYHYSEKKIDGELKPVAINIGNKLARKPRRSVWWTRNPENFDFPLFNFIQCEVRYLEDGRRTFGNEVLLIVDDKIIPEVNYHKVFYVIHEPFYKKYKKKFDEMKSYRYEKTFKYKELGRGTENHTDEWTYDKPVKPDSVTVKTFKDLLKEKVVVIADGEEFEKYKSVAKVRNGKDHYQDWIGRKEDWFKYDEETYNKKREEYEKKHGIPSYKEIHNGKFNLAEDYSELFDDVLNERFEVLLTRPKDFFKKEITLYRGSNKKVDVIKPTFLNRGTVLSPDRPSSFWSDDLDTAYRYSYSGNWLNKLFPISELELPEEIYKLKGFNSKCSKHAWFVGKIKKDEPCKVVVYLGDKLKEEDAIERFKSFTFPEMRYIYKKTVKGSDPDLGVGHNSYTREFTLDREVVPDDVISFNKFPDEFYSNIIFIKKPEDLVNFFKNIKYVKQVSPLERFLKPHEDPSHYTPKIALKTNFFKNEFINLINSRNTNNIKIISDTHIGKGLCDKKEILKKTEELAKNICKQLNREDYIILLGDIVDKSSIEYFGDIIKVLRNHLYPRNKVIYLLGNSEDELNPIKLMKKAETEHYGIAWAGYTIETDKYVFSHAPMRVPEGKINIHGHLHQSAKYWNADPSKCINISKVKGTGELVTFDEVLKYGPDKEGIELTQDPTGGKKNKVMYKLYKQYGLAEDFSYLFENVYEPPYNAEQIKKHYGVDLYNKLKSDKVHSWRMKTGIELIHKEPTKKELERIWKNWQLMPDDMKKKSDEKSIELFGVDNKTNYERLISDNLLESTSTKRTFFHLSKDNSLDGKILTPRIPKSDYKDQKTPRVCVSTSIQGCLIGINEDKDITGEVFNVYSVTSNKYKKPTKEEVKDAEITDEYWILEPVKLKYEYSIKITGKEGTKSAIINNKKFDIPLWKYQKEETMIENYFNEEDFNIFRQELLESVLDPINKTRCKEIFDDNDNMKSDVQKFILDIVNGFKKEVDFNIRNVYMIGSSTGYQYTATSDIDIEVETDLPKDKLWSIIKLIPKGTLLPNTQKPINLFVLDKDSSYDFKNAENVYDVVSGKWLKDSGKEKVEIPYPYVKGLATYFMNGCDLAISEFNKDMKELQEYMDLDPETQEISQKEKVEAIDRKIVDLRKDIDSLKMAHHVIFGFEKEGYEGMPFKISIDSELNNREERYSVNNLVYKYIDKFGYLDKMNELMRTGRDKIKEVEKYLKGLKSEDKKQLEEDYTDLLLEDNTDDKKDRLKAIYGKKIRGQDVETMSRSQIETIWDTMNRNGGPGGSKFSKKKKQEPEKKTTENKPSTDTSPSKSELKFLHGQAYMPNDSGGYTYIPDSEINDYKESLAIEAILSDTENLNEANIKPTSLRWRLVLGCMKYVSEEAYYDAFPEDRELKPSRKERTRKLKEAMNNLSQEDKQKILDMQKAKALEAKAEKIGRGHRIAGAAVGAGATVAGAVTGIAVGAHTISSIVNNSVNNAPVGAKVITGVFSSIVAIIAGVIAGAFPLIIGGIVSATSNAIAARNAKVARNKYITAANEDEIAELLEKDIKNNKDADLKEVITKNVNEDYSALFDNINKSKDYCNLFEDINSENEISNVFGTSDFRYKINDVLTELYPIVYGFISIKDGSRIDDREFIHNCDHLSDIYRVNYDPTVTLKNKLGICTDQSLATQYLMNKYHPDIDCELYALTKGRFGHCVCTLKDLDKYYYLENAWDKKRGLHGPFNSKEELEAYLDQCYHEAHDKDNDDPVFVRPYKEYIKENLNESVDWR